MQAFQRQLARIKQGMASLPSMSLRSFSTSIAYARSLAQTFLHGHVR